MYDYDHMLNGRGSRQHLQEIIKEAQHEHFIQAVKVQPDKSAKLTTIRVVLVKVLTTISKVIKSYSADQGQQYQQID